LIADSSIPSADDARDLALVVRCRGANVPSLQTRYYMWRDFRDWSQLPGGPAPQMEPPTKPCRIAVVAEDLTHSLCKVPT